jgi:hypothetical protein
MPEIGIVVPYYNFCQYEARKRNYLRFMEHMQRFNVEMLTVECVFPGQEYQVTKESTPGHLQVIAKHPMWLKENLINLGCMLLHLNPRLKVYGWFDADIEFENETWVEQSLEVLESKVALQPFQHVNFLGPDDIKSIFDKPMESFSGWYNRMNKVQVPSGIGTGGAWLIRAETYRAIGGLCDWFIVGGGDYYHAHAMIRRPCSDGILEERAKAAVRARADVIHSIVQNKVGVIPGTLKHHFHGTFENRQYGTRALKYLGMKEYNPQKDLRYINGVLHFTDNNPLLHAAVEDYFFSRKEDE